MNVTKFLLPLSICALLVAGCATPEKEIVIRTIEVQKPRLNKTAPIKPTTNDIDFDIVTKNTQDRLLEANRLYYGMNESNFELHIDNMENILLYVRELELVLEAYMAYYESEAVVDEEE